MASNDPDLPDPSGDPQPGDLIEIFRPAYQHWALYLGDGYIINLTPVGQYMQSGLRKTNKWYLTQHRLKLNYSMVTLYNSRFLLIK